MVSKQPSHTRQSDKSGTLCSLFSILFLPILLITLETSCGTEPPPSAVPDLNETVFRGQIYPLLVRDCGFPACHGYQEASLEQANLGREINERDTAALRVTGPSRARLDPETPLSSPVIEEEILDAFTRASSQTFRGSKCNESPLLRKPLEVDQGGSPHQGRGPYGRDIYASKEDPSYLVLQEWVCNGLTITEETPENLMIPKESVLFRGQEMRTESH